MTRIFIKIFPAICVYAAAVSAQTALPVNTATEAITGLKMLLPARENPKPLLVNFWATWCGPCRVEFPGLVRIDADYRAKGLEFKLVSVDNRGAMESIVADFLESYESTMPSYLLDLPSRPQIIRTIRQIAPKARNGFPLTLLYDARGNLFYQKNGVIDAKVLRAKIDKVLSLKLKVKNGFAPKGRKTSAVRVPKVLSPAFKRQSFAHQADLLAGLRN